MKIAEALRKQKEALSMPYESIAIRSGIGIATVKRAFGGYDVSLERLENRETREDSRCYRMPNRNQSNNLSKQSLQRPSREKGTGNCKASDANLCIRRSSSRCKG